MINKTRLLMCLLLLLPAAPALADSIGVAAIVNDEIISTLDAAERSSLLMASNNLKPTPENTRRIMPRVLQSLIDEAIEMQEAKRLSIVVSQKELDTAISQVEASRRLQPGSLRSSLQQQGLSVRSLEAQLRAQIAWNKVVQRKLRREVSIAQDEVARAQAAAASDPGTPEVRIAAISVLVTKPGEEAKQAEFAQQLAEKIRASGDIMAVAQEIANRPDVRISPPGWVEEEKLQPAMQQALRDLQPGQITPALKSLNTYQLVQLIERRTEKKLPDSTEVLVKELVLPVPPKPDQKMLMQLRAQAQAVSASPGSCESEAIGAADITAKAKFTRAELGMLPPDLRPVIAHLAVGEVSAPLLNEQGLRMFMLCERVEPGLGNLPPADEVKRQLFNEKIELEAQKHLRNLKREAFIEVKDGPSAAGDGKDTP